MKHLLKAAFAFSATLVALSAGANAQSVQVNALGSSGLFLELGLGASSPTAGTIHAQCVWSENTSSVSATDTSAGSATDKGSSWVAWTPASTSPLNCAVSGSTQVYAYLQTDSVVGNRCLFNGSKCKITYPNTNPAPAGLILGASGEQSLPASIANALNAFGVNAAGTDIRPEDAEFAMARVLKSCGTPVATGSQYLGLGYANGSTISSWFSSSTFNVVNFSLPTSYTVTPVGATPVLVVINGAGGSTGFSDPSIKSFTSSVLGHFLDGTDSYTTQINNESDKSGNAVTTIIREPLSGTYNTMEYNDPNTTVNKTSQDVGSTQPSGQVNCNGSVPKSNPLDIATASGGAHKRAIGTGQSLAQVIANPNSIGYGFWSVANYAGFTGSGAPNARYLQFKASNGTLYDPLLKSTVAYTGTVPTTTAELDNVDLHNVANGSYPIWSLLRLVNTGSSAPAAISNLASAAQSFVSFGGSAPRPDFIISSKLTVVRSHFTPPAGTGEPATPANGHVGLPSSSCTAAEAGGDVGGVVYTLAADSSYCKTNNNPRGQTGHRL